MAFTPPGIPTKLTTYQTVPVAPALTPYIREIAIQVEPDDAKATASHYAVYPKPFPVLGVQYRGSLSVIIGPAERALDPSGITGLQATVRRFRPRERAGSLLVTFEPHGAYALLGCDMRDIAGAHVGLSGLLDSSLVGTLQQRVMDATTPAERVRIVESFFCALASKARREADPTVSEAARRLLAARGQRRVDALAGDLGVSARQLERLFRQQIGVGPKRFASLVRFDWARRQIAARAPAVTVAAEAGYADQAHFTRDFQAWAGETPRRYLDAAR